MNDRDKSSSYKRNRTLSLNRAASDRKDTLTLGYVFEIRLTKMRFLSSVSMTEVVIDIQAMRLPSNLYRLSREANELERRVENGFSSCFHSGPRSYQTDPQTSSR